MRLTSRRQQSDELARLRSTADMEEKENIESGGTADPQSDEDLMAQIKSDHRTLDVLMRRYQPSLLHFLAGRLGNFATAEEVAQETWMKVLRSAATFDQTRGAFRVWLFRIASNAANDRRRRSRNETSESDWKREDEEPGLDGIPSNTPPPDAAVLGTVSNIEALNECLENLPADAREAVTRCVIEKDPFDEVAKTLNISEPSLRRLCNRAVRSIQWCMRTKGYPPGRQVICEDFRFDVSLIDTTTDNPDAYDLVVWPLDPSIGRCWVVARLASVSGTAQVDVELNQFTFDKRRFGDRHRGSLGIANALGAVRASVEIRQ
jgi:RNA polymerase sigma-70 factor (ECF subfamily)